MLSADVILRYPRDACMVVLQRILLGEPKRALGRHAGVLEAKIIGSLGLPHLRCVVMVLWLVSCGYPYPATRGLALKSD